MMRATAAVTRVRSVPALMFFVCAASAPVAAQTIAIAPLDEALTFAATGEGAARRVLAVTSYRDGVVEAVDLGSEEVAGDAVDRLGAEGYDALRTRIATASTRVVVNAADLVTPVRLAAHHIAVGTNYRAHAEEANVEGGPFLFPKIVAPTGPRAPIPLRKGALTDYEVELCLVTLAPLPAETRAAQGGLILCNDVTDRAALLRHVDAARPQSGRGFPEGKSAPGYMPVGDLFVAPRDVASFAATLHLTLSVNGETRQSAPVALWIWDFDRILEEARAGWRREWPYWNGVARLPVGEDGVIPARTMLLAGTPAGTVFDGFGWTDYVGGLWTWGLGGFRGPASRRVIEAYIARATKDGGYLRRGDVVSIEVDRMGTLRNVVR